MKQQQEMSENKLDLFLRIFFNLFIFFNKVI